MIQKLSLTRQSDTHERHFSWANGLSCGSTVRKQWALYLNDAVSIFQSRQRGPSSGIIVMRPTGCPEEEIGAELYASIQGQRGARQGSSHCTSALLVSSRVSPDKWDCCPNLGCHDLCILLHGLGRIYPSTTDTDQIYSDEEKMEAQKLDSSLGTKTI